MNFELRDSNKVVACNTEKLHAFEIPYLFHFVICSRQAYILNYIDLLLDSGSNDPKSALYITIAIKDGEAIQYAVCYADISSEKPLRLLLEKPLPVKSFIDIYIRREIDSPDISIWVNNSGPCFTVVGDFVRALNLARTPLFSIITPVYKTSIKYLSEMIASVEAQIYPEWELCLVNDGSRDSDLTKYLDSLKNPRIKIKHLKKNVGIALATNNALEMATGEYLCLVDHDDLIAPSALLEIASVLDRNPESELVYSDEDKVNEEGVFVDPFFKPDWSYNLLLSQNYICHLSTFRTANVKRLGGLCPSYEGSQDYDLLLRVTEGLDDSKIVHLPKILYHWRIHPESTASNIEVKPEAHVSALKAIKNHLFRVGESRASVTVGAYLGTYKVTYPLDEGLSVNVIIPTRDNPVYLDTCIFSVLQSTYKNLYITIVDNGSKDSKTLKLLENMQDIPRCQVLRYNKPFNFSAINNYAVKYGYKADRYIFLNDDTEVIAQDWVEQLVQHIGRNKVAVVGAKLLYGNNKIQHAGVIIGIGGVAGHSHKHFPNSIPGYFSRPHLVQNVSAVTGACLAIDAETFELVGGFEDSLPRAFNDVDFCLKVRAAGFKIVYNPYACLYHHESISRGLDNHKEKLFADAIEYMQKKWDCKNFKDPYYNPNLTLVSENFSYRIDT
jgi:O-antigen biosynthesis protein